MRWPLRRQRKSDYVLVPSPEYTEMVRAELDTPVTRWLYAELVNLQARVEAIHPPSADPVIEQAVALGRMIGKTEIEVMRDLELGVHVPPDPRSER